MKKLTSIIFAALIIAALTGCNSGETISDNSENNSSQISDNSGNSQSSDNSDNNSSETEKSGIDITAQFELPSGEPVDLTNAVVYGYKGEIPLSEMTDDNWVYVQTDYVYLAEPLGIYYDSEKNADIYDENEAIFKGSPETAAHNYKKYKVGDMFGGLKLTEATTTFFNEWAFQSLKYFNGGRAMFEGEITVTGKCFLAPETDGYIIERDIRFIPDAQGSKLPIMNYSSDENGNENLCSGMANDFCWLGEYSIPIHLGNADNYPDLDFADFPDDGSLVNVKVTLNNIYFRNELNHLFWYGASIVDMKVVK